MLVARRDLLHVRARFPKRSAALAQAAYYTPSGIWPIAHIRSFEWLTGPKTDRWLVKTVGALITVTGVVVGLAALSDRLTPEIELLGAGSALSLAAVDVVYVARGRIRPIYLLDAVVNLGLAAAYAANIGGDPAGRSSEPRVSQADER